MQINKVRYKIDKVGQEIEFIKQSWIQKQNKNMQLLNQYNKQFNDLNKVRKCKYILYIQFSIYVYSLYYCAYLLLI